MKGEKSAKNYYFENGANEMNLTPALAN